MVYGEDLEKFLTFSHRYKENDEITIQNPKHYIGNWGTVTKRELKEVKSCCGIIKYIGKFGFTVSLPDYNNLELSISFNDFMK